MQRPHDAQNKVEWTSQAWQAQQAQQAQQAPGTEEDRSLSLHGSRMLAGRIRAQWPTLRTYTCTKYCLPSKITMSTASQLQLP